MMVRYTTCGCTDGRHRDPKAATRCHALRTDAGIIAKHTGRHVIREDQVGNGLALPDGWRIARMTGGSGTFSHGFIAVAPGCPTHRHPTRDCQCGTAVSYDAAAKRAVKTAGAGA